MIESRLSKVSCRIDRFLISLYRVPVNVLGSRYGIGRVRISLGWAVLGEIAAIAYLAAAMYEQRMSAGNGTRLVIPVFLTAGYSFVFFRNMVRRGRFIEAQSMLLEQHLMSEVLPFETDLQRRNYVKAALWYPISIGLSVVSVLYQVAERIENPMAVVQACAFILAINGVYGARYTLFVGQDVISQGDMKKGNDTIH